MTCRISGRTATYYFVSAAKKKAIGFRPNLRAAIGMINKTCTKCGIGKPISAFYTHKSCAGGHRPECKACCNAACKVRLANDPLLNRRSHLKRKFGIDHKRYEEILASQGGGCAICGSAKSRNGQMLHIDHDHVTGEIRGVLCDKCNRGIGLLGDSAERLEAARNYLDKRKTTVVMAVVKSN
jgi:hypothetical protein